MRPLLSSETLPKVTEGQCCDTTTLPSACRLPPSPAREGQMVGVSSSPCQGSWLRSRLRGSGAVRLPSHSFAVPPPWQGRVENLSADAPSPAREGRMVGVSSSPCQGSWLRSRLRGSGAVRLPSHRFAVPPPWQGRVENLSADAPSPAREGGTGDAMSFPFAGAQSRVPVNRRARCAPESRALRTACGRCAARPSDSRSFLRHGRARSSYAAQ